MYLTKKERERVEAVTKALAPLAVGDLVKIGKEHSHHIKARYVGTVGQVLAINGDGKFVYVSVSPCLRVLCHRDAIHYATEEEIANHKSK